MALDRRGERPKALRSFDKASADLPNGSSSAYQSRRNSVSCGVDLPTLGQSSLLASVGPLSLSHECGLSKVDAETQL